MVKIILADNQAIFRAGIAKVLAVEDDVRIVAQAQTVDQVMLALDKFRASLLIFASNFVPDLPALVAAANRFQTRMVVVAENSEPSDKFIQAGVHGVAYRSITGDDLLRCVRAVAHGERYVHSSKMPVPMPDSEDFVGARVRDRLTPKEL